MDMFHELDITDTNRGSKTAKDCTVMPNLQ